MESLQVELQSLITKIAKDNGIENFTVTLSNSVSGDGDGYIGILDALYVIDKDSDKKLNLVLKRAPASQNLRKLFPTRQTFLREIILYEDVFPEFKSFQDEYKIPHPFDSVTNFYGSISDEFKEALILENLKADGFRLCNRREPLDAHHLTLGMTTYARLHAVSLAMKHLEPERFERVTSKIKHNLMSSFRPPTVANNSTKNKGITPDTMFDDVFAPTFEVVKDDPRLVEGVQILKKNMEEFVFQDLIKTGQHELAVVVHADCWCANLLFKYEDEHNPNTPTKVNLIDWQMSTLSHPIHDISYFFAICAGKADLKNYKKYLEVYHKTLCDTLTAFGLDPQTIIPWELLEGQWKIYCKIGFFMCLIMLQQTLSETKTHDFEKMAEKGEELFEFRWGKQISDRFRQRMKDLVEFYIDNDLI